MRKGRVLLVAAVVALLGAGCAADGAPPPVATAPRALPALLVDAPMPDVIRMLDYLKSRTGANCLEPVFAHLNEAVGILTSFATARYPAERRNAVITDGRTAVSRAELVTESCRDRIAAEKPPGFGHRALNDYLALYRTMDTEAVTVINGLNGTLRQQFVQIASGDNPPLLVLASAAGQVAIAAFNLEIRFREMQAPLLRPTTVGGYGNQARLHARRAQVLMVEYGLKMPPDPAIASRGLDQVVQHRRYTALMRGEMAALAVQMNSLPPNLLADGRKVTENLNEALKLEEELAGLLDSFFRTGDRATARQISELSRRIEETDQRLLRDMPDILRRLLGGDVGTA